MKYANNIWQAGSKPLHVGLLLLDESNMLSLAAAVDPMRACNRRADREAIFLAISITDRRAGASHFGDDGADGKAARGLPGIC